jgi:hypothetical protein
VVPSESELDIYDGVYDDQCFETDIIPNFHGQKARHNSDVVVTHMASNVERGGSLRRQYVKSFAIIANKSA